MLRRPRIEIAGYYHIINRGVEQRVIFKEPADYCQVQSKNAPQRRANMYQLATKKVAPQVKEFLPFVFV